MKPMVNQVQYHVGMGAPTTSGVNMTDMPAPSKPTDQPSYSGITYQSFSPLCGPCDTTELINGPMVTKIGKAHGKSGAQVSLRWQVQRGIPGKYTQSTPQGDSRRCSHRLLVI